MRINFPRLLLLLVLPLHACATLPGPAAEHDPLERFNRSVYAFNESVDKAVLKPVAQGYTAVVPRVARTGINNFFSNLDDVVVIFNDLLQFKLHQSLQDTSRLVFNSTIGLFGLIDVASGMGLPKHNEDFGQTLGHWGVASGPYLVLPFLGPSSLRDGAGRVPDYYLSPLWQMQPKTTRNAAVAVDAVSTRASLLEAEEILDTAALDPYAYLREAYLQRRQNLVYDGNPPADPTFDEDELLDEEF